MLRLICSFWAFNKELRKSKSTKLNQSVPRLATTKGKTTEGSSGTKGENAMAIDFSRIVRFSNGVRLINCTPHPVVFLDGDKLVEAQPCGATLLAVAVETPAGNFGAAQLVKTVFQTSPQGEEELAQIERRQVCSCWVRLSARRPTQVAWSA
ncbi:MAG: hypothetical protein KatS3mg101_0167 [Patescibacteria group bacterium]|nr:MAG: hypothetical protein KatS3mg101_0167 [Patescibacteria group bacterium]